VVSHIRESIVILRGLVAAGYEGSASLSRRIDAMERWLEAPTLLRADLDAVYAAIIDIDAGDLHEPLLACPNDPDDIRPLPEVAGSPVDEVFIGSCMTHISGRRSHRGPRVLALHGQSGPGGRRGHRRIHFDPQLPQPDG
jgi:aconitate hydratase 2/2-methylisocitrate dehydratase